MSCWNLVRQRVAFSHRIRAVPRTQDVLVNGRLLAVNIRPGKIGILLRLQINLIVLQTCSPASCSHPFAQEVVAKEEVHVHSSCASRLLGSMRGRRRVVHNVGGMGFKMVAAAGRCSTIAIVVLWRV